jgi:hypothetical protein
MPQELTEEIRGRRGQLVISLTGLLALSCPGQRIEYLIGA